VSTCAGGERVAIRLSEVEAYGGRHDPASHAYRSRTERNEPMWAEPGTLYVYLSYGIHWCANIVVGPKGTPTAVLLRGGTVVEGADIAAARRGRADQLADGPGKIGQALGLDGATSGTTLWEGPLRLDGPLFTVTLIDATPRIGISKAMDVPWRFVERTGTDAPSSSLP
jgi:DNA-3-methyladenine glycosylase